MAGRVVVVDVTISPWLRDVLFAMGQLLAAVEQADDVLITDEVLERAAELRQVIDRGAG